MNYKYFSNKKCEYYKCHKINKSLTIKEDIKNFNCLFCYCPLYPYKCNGNYKILENGIKDCSDCIYPHIPENYDKIIGKLYNYVMNGEYFYE